MDLGLDLEAYKDYINNLKQFAHLNHDFEIYARDQLLFINDPKYKQIVEARNDEATPELMNEAAQFKYNCENIVNTLIKLRRKANGFLTKKDIRNLEEFRSDMRKYLYDFEVFA